MSRGAMDNVFVMECEKGVKTVGEVQETSYNG